MEAGFRVIRRALPKIRRSRRASLAQRLAAFVISVSAALPVATEPACPEPLVKGDKLVLVLSAGFDSLRARVRLFEKDKAAGWRSNGPAKPAVLGMNGLAWSWRDQQHAAFHTYSRPLEQNACAHQMIGRSKQRA